LTQAIAVPHEPDAQAPRWEQFLREVFKSDAEVIAYFQRAVGYTLTGSIQEQCFFLLHGGGENGKSTCMGVLSDLWGDYAVKADQETVLFAEKNRGRGASPELMRLQGKRLAFIDEMERERSLDEARIKALTGSEQSSGRNLYEGTIEFMNTAKIWFDLNDLPKFTGVDRGISRRPRVIPFDQRFPPELQDKTLLDTLKRELPGILAWAVRGCLAWQRDGLMPPGSVSLATREYVEEQNHLPAFLRDCYYPDSQGEVSGADLQQEYAGWCVQNGVDQMRWQTQVVPFLKSAKLKHERTKHGKLWIGLRKIDPSLPIPERAGKWHV
jgi:putative DNA primase/helicase